MWWHDGPDGWWLVWMSLMMLLVWLPIIVIAIWALRGFASPHRHDERSRPPGARETAREAYARGELTRERFLGIIEDLDRTAGDRPR